MSPIACRLARVRAAIDAAGMVRPFRRSRLRDDQQRWPASRASQGRCLRGPGRRRNRRPEQAVQVVQRRKTPSRRPRTHPNSRPEPAGPAGLHVDNQRGREATQETGKFQRNGWAVGVYRGMLSLTGGQQIERRATGMSSRGCSQPRGWREPHRYGPQFFCAGHRVSVSAGPAGNRAAEEGASQEGKFSPWSMLPLRVSGVSCKWHHFPFPFSSDSLLLCACGPLRRPFLLTISLNWR
jgi:hypothetical protein